MTDQPIIAAHPRDPQVSTAPPFALSLWDSAKDIGEVDFVVHVPTSPRSDVTATNALMVGIAMLIADHQGLLDDLLARTFPEGPPSETEAVAYADLLIQGEANALAA